MGIKNKLIIYELNEINRILIKVFLVIIKMDLCTNIENYINNQNLILEIF